MIKGQYTNYGFFQFFLFQIQPSSHSRYTLLGEEKQLNNILEKYYPAYIRLLSNDLKNNCDSFVSLIRFAFPTFFSNIEQITGNNASILI